MGATIMPPRRAGRNCGRSAHADRAGALGMIHGSAQAALPGAVGAAEVLAVALDAVADNADAAVVALRRQLVDGTLEAVERVPAPVQRDFDGAMILVAAGLAGAHENSDSLWPDVYRV